MLTYTKETLQVIDRKWINTATNYFPNGVVTRMKYQLMMSVAIMLAVDIEYISPTVLRNQ
jgi:hypothetical protein